MNPSTKRKITGGILISLFILLVCVAGWKFFVQPKQEEVVKQEEVKKAQLLITKTSSAARYDWELNFAADGFSGYSIIRSEETQNLLINDFKGKLNIYDDGADYNARLDRLAKGEVDMAVFTWDALIKTSAERGELPATIVAFVDESTGADAVVAHKKAFPNVDALNSPETRFVCVLNSPAETLVRVLMTHFNMDNLADNPFVFMDNAETVYNEYKKSSPSDKKVFVLWEPYVSKMSDNPDYHIVLDSSKFKGYIVDVIVANRQYLSQHPDRVEAFVKSYFASVFQYRNNMQELVKSDSVTIGSPLTESQADFLVDKIWWKNTRENYGHFGLISSSGLQHADEIGSNITNVLLKTGAIQKDPTNGRPNLLYYDQIFRKMFESGWHPGFGTETVRKEAELKELSESDWKKLKPVGTLSVPRLVFRRGTSSLSEKSEEVLKELAEKLKNWPQYYVIVEGHAQKSDDPEQDKINQELAFVRAKVAVDWLVKNGITSNRINAVVNQPNGSTTTAFIFGEIPY